MQRGFLLNMTLFLLGAMACQPEPHALARVGETILLQADLDYYQKSHPRPGQATGEILDAMITQTLLAEQAKKHQMLKDPAVQAELRQAERTILARHWQEKQFSIGLSEENLKKSYETRKKDYFRRQIHVADIVFHPSTSRDKHADDTLPKRDPRARAEQVYARLKAGQSFVALVREFSDDNVSRQRDGDLGSLREGQINATFFDAAFALQKDEVSTPIAVGDSFHVLKALEPPQNMALSYEEARGPLRQALRAEYEKQILAEARRNIAVNK